MKITETSLNEEEQENNDWRDRLSITVSFESPDVEDTTLSFSDGEPEDANLSRDFND